ncbi:hypothetical protein H6G76_23410 [Nostoc sp. FACHB-152]|uniref:hypothetical protein n=1 Tax=Nostoc sp. FACHB-152 TaxID=2692837 RepID=UPI0016869C08|nr:hypothetical protein [Nostoc sp. FACHB-152]MBD2450056.1 hypothetical protein [Nostoc sp. FACHB-152]
MYALKPDKKAQVLSQLWRKPGVAKKKVSPVTPEASPHNPLTQYILQMGNSPNISTHASILNRTPANQQSSNWQLLLHLQQLYGNHYVNQVLQLLLQMDEGRAIALTEPSLEESALPAPVEDNHEQEAEQIELIPEGEANLAANPLEEN